MNFTIKDKKTGEFEEPKSTTRKFESKNIIELNKATRSGVYLFGLIIFCIGFCLCFAATFSWLSPVTVLISLCVGGLVAMSVRISLQWERVVILRFGRFNRVSGPGLYFLIPFIEYPAIYVDQRIMTSSFSAEAALTADSVPVDMDGVLFWVVWDAQKACLEVENYPRAVLWSAQTAMRDAVGQMNLTELSSNRQRIDRELQKHMGEKCEGWGITIISVEIRDITIPRELEDALSREAQAEREKNARTMLAEVEIEISEMMVEAADIYDKNPKALKLRSMNLAYEGARDGKGIIFAPSNFAEGFNLEKTVSGE